MNRKFIVAVLVVIGSVIAVSLWSSSSRKQATTNKIEVAASFYPLAEFVRQVGGDKVKVTNLTPVGTEPHDFEPSPQDIVKIQRSKVLIYTGAGFEPWADRVVPGLKSITIINASQGMTLLPAIPEAGVKPNAHNTDPHFYLDPVLDQKVLKTIAAKLAKVDPANKAFYQKNASAYAQKLKALDGKYKAGLANLTSRNIVTSHAAFAYIAKRYGLNQTPIAGLSVEEPSAARLAEIARFARQNNVKYIFFEKLISPRLSDTIAREVGAKTLVLDPIEGLTPDEQRAGKTFITLSEDNLANLRLALGAK